MNPHTTGLVLAAILISALATALWRARREVRRLREHNEATACDLESLQGSFARFVPREVIERVIATGVSTSGERKDVTVLFADLVGFTALSESVDPTVLVKLLNGYFERMSQAVSEHRGHVSTFLGDGILALFGALQPDPWQANNAARAALAMRQELEEYNLELAEEGLPPLEIGIGIHRGHGIAGLVGSRDLLQFAFVGQVVNTAARLQDYTRTCETDILITQSAQQDMDPRFVLRAMPPVALRGIEKPVAIYAMERFEEQSHG